MQQNLRVTGNRLTIYAAIAANLAIAQRRSSSCSRWSLLTGEAASPDVVRSIREIANQHDGVDAGDPRTMHFGPDVVHVDLDVQVDPSLSGRDLLDAAKHIEDAVRERHPTVRRVSFRFAESSTR